MSEFGDPSEHGGELGGQGHYLFGHDGLPRLPQQFRVGQKGLDDILGCGDVDYYSVS